VHNIYDNIFIEEFYVVCIFCGRMEWLDTILLEVCYITIDLTTFRGMFYLNRLDCKNWFSTRNVLYRIEDLFFYSIYIIFYY